MVFDARSSVHESGNACGAWEMRAILVRLTVVRDGVANDEHVRAGCHYGLDDAQLQPDASGLARPERVSTSRDAVSRCLKVDGTVSPQRSKGFGPHQLCSRLVCRLSLGLWLLRRGHKSVPVAFRGLQEPILKGVCHALHRHRCKGAQYQAQ